MDERRRKGFTLVMSNGVEGMCVLYLSCFLLKRLWNRKKLLRLLLLTERRRIQGNLFLDEELEISLNAITGTPNPKTMRVIGV
jgi:hypothetical protein